MLNEAIGKSRISPEDHAVPMVDEVERPAHIRQRFAVGYFDEQQTLPRSPHHALKGGNTWTGKHHRS